MIERVVEAPTHIVDGDEEAEVGATDNGLTVTVVLTHVVELQVPSALTQYVVVEAGLTAGAAPEVTYVPAQEVVYHFHVAPSVLRLPPVIESVVEAPTHIVDGDEEAEVGATDN